jgi:hypothetical protein
MYGKVLDKYAPVVAEPKVPLDFAAMQAELGQLAVLEEVELDMGYSPEEFDESHAISEDAKRQRYVPLAHERNSPIKTRTRRVVTIRHTSIYRGILKNVENFAAYDENQLSHLKDTAALDKANSDNKEPDNIHGYVSIDEAAKRARVQREVDEVKLGLSSSDNLVKAPAMTHPKMDPDLKAEDMKLPKPKYVYQFRPVADLTEDNAHVLFEKEYDQLELTVLRTIPVQFNQKEENAIIKDTFGMYYPLLRELYNSCSGLDGTMRVSVFLNIMDQCKVQDDEQLPSSLIQEEITELCNDMFSTQHGGQMPFPSIIHSVDYDDEDESVLSGVPGSPTGRMYREAKSDKLGKIFDDREHLKTLSRPQFLCSLYQVALSKFFELEGPPSEKLMSFFDEHVVPHADTITCDYFKRKLLAAPVQDLFRKYERSLYDLYLRYCGIAPLPSKTAIPGANGGRRVYGDRVLEPYSRTAVASARFTPQNQHLLLVDYLLLGKNLTSKKALQAYLSSRDENTMVHSHLYLGYASFLEMLARLASLRRPNNALVLLVQRNIAENSVAELVILLDSLLQILCYHKKAQSIFTRSKIHRMVKRFKKRHPQMAERSVAFFSKQAQQKEFKSHEDIKKRKALEAMGVGEVETHEWTEYEYELFPHNLRAEYAPEERQDVNMRGCMLQGMDVLTNVAAIYPDRHA